MKTFVVEISPIVSPDGSTSTFYFSKVAWTTRPTDTPANTRVRGLLKQAGSLRRELFSGARVTGAITPGFGNIVLANPAPTIGEEGELDDWGDYAISGARVVCRWGDPDTDAYPSEWTTVYIAYGHSMIVDLYEIRIVLRDRLQLFDKPVVADGFLGTGGIEGNGSVSLRKQFVAGDPGFFPPILVDVNDQIYFVQSTSPGSFYNQFSIDPDTFFFAVYDNGVQLDRQLPDYSTAQELIDDEPDAGYVRFWFGPTSQVNSAEKDGPVYFRLGSPPAGDVRVYGYGEPNDNDYNLGFYSGSFHLSVLAGRCGILSADVDASAGNIAVSGVLVNDNRTFLDLLSDSCLLYQSYFGFNRLDVLVAGYLKDPEDEEFYYGISPGLLNTTLSPSTSVYEFTESSVKDLKREPVPGMEAPVWKVSASVGQTWPSQLATGATNQLKDYLSRDPYWTSFSGVSTNTILENPGAIFAEVTSKDRQIQNVFGSRLFVERYFVLYGGKRHIWTFSAPMSEELLELELHNVVTLKTPRFGLSAGKKYRIVSITIECDDAGGPKMRFVLWGGTAGQLTGFNGGPGSVAGNSSNTPTPFITPTQNNIGDFSGVFVGSTSVSSFSSDGEEEIDQDDPNQGATGSIALSRNSIGNFFGQFLGEVGPETDDDFGDVSLLLHFDGVDGSTTFTDNSPIGHTVTAVGSAAIDDAQSVIGGTSGLFPRTGSGGGDKLTVPAHASFNLSGDFTIEFRFRTTAASTGQTVFRCEGDSGTGWEILKNNLGNIYFSWIDSGTPLATYSGLVSDTWYAIAFQRSGSTISHHVNGLYGSANTSTDSSTMTGDGALTVGGRTGSTSLDMTGWLDEVRITKGVARYGATNYTPRTTAFPDA